MHRVLLSGYYGFGNIGDEAILAATVQSLRARLPDLGISVLSESPSETSRDYGVEAFYRMSLPQVIGAFRNADLIVFGGGSLLQDSTSFRSLAYYLSILFLAKIMGKPVIIYANGIGPLKSHFGRYLTKSLLNTVTEISVRDDESLRLLREIGVVRQIKVTADPAFLLEAAPPPRVGQILQESGIDSSMPMAWLALRPGRMSGAFYDSLAKAVAYLRREKLFPCLLVMQERDMPVVQALNQSLKDVFEPEVPHVSGLTPSEALGVLKRGEFCFGMRLHTLILAAKAGVPSMGVEIDPKIGAFCRGLDLPVLKDPAHTPNTCLEQAMKAFVPDRHKRAKDLQVQLPRLVSLAQQNVDLIVDTLTRSDSRRARVQ
jgi:polysaccharide pyruvyl transferase CsaB